MNALASAVAMLLLLSGVAPAYGQRERADSVAYPAAQQAEPARAERPRARRSRSRSARPSRRARITRPSVRYISTQRATWEKITRQYREVDHLLFGSDLPFWYLVPTVLNAALVFGPPVVASTPGGDLLAWADGDDGSEADGEAWDPGPAMVRTISYLPPPQLSEALRGGVMVGSMLIVLGMLSWAVPIFWKGSSNGVVADRGDSTGGARRALRHGGRHRVAASEVRAAVGLALSYVLRALRSSRA